MTPLTNEINDAVRNTQSACCLHTTTDEFNLGLEFLLVHTLLLALLLTLQLGEVLLSEVGEARDDVAADQLLGFGDISLLRNLDLETAVAKIKVEHLLNTGGIGRRDYGLVLGDLVTAGDSEVDTAFTDESRNVGGGEEDQGDGVVLDQGDVEPRVTVELDIRALQQIQACLVEAAL